MEETRDRVEELKGRIGRCRCKYCGSSLELRRIIYGELENARIEIFCSKCDRIEYGVESEIYEVGKYFVEEMDFNAYPDLDHSEKTKQMSIAKVCEIIAWGCKNLNLMNENGFCYPIHTLTGTSGEAMIIDDETLQQIKDVSCSIES